MRPQFLNGVREGFCWSAAGCPGRQTRGSVHDHSISQRWEWIFVKLLLCAHQYQLLLHAQIYVSYWSYQLGIINCFTNEGIQNWELNLPEDTRLEIDSHLQPKPAWLQSLSSFLSTRLLSTKYVVNVREISLGHSRPRAHFIDDYSICPRFENHHVVAGWIWHIT